MFYPRISIRNYCTNLLKLLYNNPTVGQGNQFEYFCQLVEDGRRSAEYDRQRNEYNRQREEASRVEALRLEIGRLEEASRAWRNGYLISCTVFIVLAFYLVYKTM